MPEAIENPMDSPEVVKRVEELTKKAVYLETAGTLSCQFCGNIGRREAPSDVEPTTNIKNPIKNPHLLTLLWPDEKWICNACLRNLTRRMTGAR